MAYLPHQGQTQGPCLLDTRERMEVQRVGEEGLRLCLPFPLSSSGRQVRSWSELARSAQVHWPRLAPTAPPSGGQQFCSFSCLGLSMGVDPTGT